jgi:hypothetical protein
VRVRPLLLALLGPALGCVVRTSVTSGAPPPAAPPSAPSQAATTAAASAPAPVAPIAPAPEDPRAPSLEARRLFVAALERSEIPIAPGQRVPRVLIAGLEGTARGAAAGMTPQGEPTVAVLAEGARLALRLPLQSGECHAVVAQGGLGVVELDLYLTRGMTRGPASEPDIVAEDHESGPVAVLRGEGGCLEAAARGPLSDGVLHATLRRGAGLVAVQIYKR